MTSAGGDRGGTGMRRGAMVAGVAVAAVLAPAGGAFAATRHVTTGADTVAGSLRAVIGAAAPGDVVVIDPGVQPVLASGEIVIDKDLEVDGTGARSTTVDAAGTGRVFHITGDAAVTIASLRLTGGTGRGGGANNLGGAIFSGNDAFDPQPRLTLRGVQVDHNSVDDSASGIVLGGGVAAFGDLTLDRTAILANTLTGAASGSSQTGLGGGVDFGFPGDQLTITNSTIAHNVVTSGDPGGGGVHIFGPGLHNADHTAHVSIDHSTIADNAAVSPPGHPTAGGNLVLNGAGTTVLPDVALRHTIIAGGQATVGPNCYPSPAVAGAAGFIGGFTSLGYNLDALATSDCGLSTTAHDIIGADPLLPATAGDHGGPTDTLPPQPGSPAIAAIPAALCTPVVDQLGLPRPAAGKTACDIGAFETTYDTTPPVTTATPSPSAVARGPVTVTFSADDHGGSGVASVTTQVGSTAPTTVAGASRSLTVSSSTPTTITYFATDRAGNRETARTITVALDRSAPGIPTVTPLLRLVTSSGPAVVSGRAHDNVGVAAVEVHLTGAGFTHTYRASCPTCGSIGATDIAWSLDLAAVSPAVPRGLFEEDVTAIDLAGNPSPLPGVGIVTRG